MSIDNCQHDWVFHNTIKKKPHMSGDQHTYRCSICSLVAFQPTKSPPSKDLKFSYAGTEPTMGDSFEGTQAEWDAWLAEWREKKLRGI